MRLLRRLSRTINHVLPRRRRHHLLASALAAPAVLVLVSIVGLGILLSASSYRVRAWYHQQGLNAISQQDFVKARLCFSSLLKGQPENQEYQYGLAVSLAGLGEHRAAYAILDQLTSEEGPGYLPAHIFLAERLIGAPDADEQSLRQAEAHLRKVISVQPKDTRANGLLAVIYARTDQWDLVKQHLPNAGSGVDEISLAAAQQFARRDDWDEAEIWARRAAGYYANLLKATPRDKDLRIKCAQANLFARDFQRALKVLEEGWELEELPVYRQAIAQVCGLWVTNSPSLDAPQRLALIDRALAYDAQSSKVLKLLLDLVTYDASEMVLPATMPVEGAVARAMAQCVHYCRQGDAARVGSELEHAYAIQPDMTVAVAANLAAVWAFSDEPDAPSARLLAAALHELRPSDVITQRAMGLVLSRQQEDEQALRLLQAVLASMPEDRAVHSALADIYERLGQTDRAEHHRRLGTPPATAPSSTTAPSSATAHR